MCLLYRIYTQLPDIYDQTTIPTNYGINLLFLAEVECDQCRAGQECRYCAEDGEYQCQLGE